MAKCCGLTKRSRVSPQQIDLKVHALHYANELHVRIRLSFHKLLQTHLICRNNFKKNVWEKSNDAHSSSIRAQTARNHINFFSICFYHNINIKENVFFRVRAGMGIVWHIDASSVVWTLIYHGKLANQSARLAAIVVKIIFECTIRQPTDICTCCRGTGLHIMPLRPWICQRVLTKFPECSLPGILDFTTLLN